MTQNCQEGYRATLLPEGQTSSQPIGIPLLKIGNGRRAREGNERQQREKRQRRWENRRKRRWERRARVMELIVVMRVSTVTCDWRGE